MELLVVLGIIVILMGIILPAFVVVRRNANSVRMKSDIQVLSAGLEAYRNDHRSYPRLNYYDYDPNGGDHVMNNAFPGTVLLCWALIGPGTAGQDGHDGPGFTAIPNGQVYGPYVEPSKFKVELDPVASNILKTTPSTVFAEPRYILEDMYGHPILYFLANSANNISVTINGNTNGGYVDYIAPPLPAIPNPPPTFPMYNLADDSGLLSASSHGLCYVGEADQIKGLQRMRMLLGDMNNSGTIDAGETAVSNPYLLWSAGSDEVFGFSLDPVGGNGAASLPGELVQRAFNCDDATNFRK